MSNKVRFTIRNENISPAYLAQFREKFYDIEYLSPRVYKDISRYKNVRRIQDESTGKIYHETMNQYLVDESKDDIIFEVNVETENRLDMISQIYYTTPKYWWVIAQANYIIDPFDVPYGTRLRIPPLTSLYNEGGILYG
ncbi:hypothetical protein [uncultured Clostridium sp.]|uniref:hypothetical protein n=1 Tax=uncultured Clostridium sp. TaxID=59620 RepID=UPI0026ECD2C1|nr:hypothetical protein [uncultured Clostridium sp.]